MNHLRPSDSRNISRLPSKKRPAKDTLHPGPFPLLGAFDFRWAPSKRKAPISSIYIYVTGRTLKAEKRPAKEKLTQRVPVVKTGNAYGVLIMEVLFQHAHKMSFRATKRVRMSVLFFGAPSLLC